MLDLHEKLLLASQRIDQLKARQDELARILFNAHPTDRFTYEPDQLIPALERLKAERTGTITR